MTLHELQRRLQKFNIRREVVQVLEETKGAIEELNRDQLNSGQLSNGRFNRSYSRISVQVYGKRPGPIRLYETGAFWEGIKVKNINLKFLEIVGEDSKTPMLLKEYGEKIFGLTKASKAEYVNRSFGPALKMRIEQKLGIALT